MPEPRSSVQGVVRFGPFELDLPSGELRRNGVRTRIQDQPLRVLARLLERPGEVLTRQELRRELWPSDTFVDFEHGLNAAVRRLRGALGDSADTPRFIETLPRRGYRFIGTVSGNGGRAAGVASDTGPASPSGAGASTAGRRRWTWAGAGVLLGIALATIGGTVSNRRRRKWLGAGLLVASALIVVASSIDWSRETPVPNRVAIAVFENQTGDPSVTSLGQLAAGRLIGTLKKTLKDVDVLPQAVDAGDWTGDNGSDGAAGLAGAPGRWLLVTGNYFDREDEREFQVRILDLANPSAFYSAAISAPVSAIDGALERLEQIVAGAVAIHFDEFFGGLGVISAPPTLAAYLEYDAGRKAFASDHRRALAHFEDALEIEPGFCLPRVWMYFAHANLGESDKVEEDLSLLESGFPHFKTEENALVDYLRADWENRPLEALPPLRYLQDRMPRSRGVNLNLMMTLGRLNRASAVVETYDQLPAGPVGYQADTWRLGLLVMFLHLQADYERELRESLEAQRAAPGHVPFLAAEARALAALDRVDEVNGVIDKGLTVALVSGTPGQLMNDTARELRVHEHKEASLQLASRAVAWQRSRPPEVRAQEGHRAELAEALYLAGRSKEALERFSELATDWPNNVGYLGAMGAAAARSGQQERARRIAAELEQSAAPDPFAERLVSRARIAAQLDDPAAVDLLRDAVVRGFPFWLLLHDHPDFGPLRKDPSFLALVQPQ